MNFSYKYKVFTNLEKTVHGTKIKEGNLLEGSIHKNIKETGNYTEVTNGKSIPLNGNTTRKNHKVDIFCKNDEQRIIRAYNSKGKSFNNTESGEPLLKEYLSYKEAIQQQYPGYDVTYAILKDEYDPNNGKYSKYHYLNQNGIPVYHTYGYLAEKYNIITETIENQRLEETINILRGRFRESKITKEELISLLFDDE